ncbi:MAG TPA: Hpt domain-containing protein, partial [Planctomycetaceae bacterium]|nr:Hpt domain-containing protein [Planctomycetaceae bacterium]
KKGDAAIVHRVAHTLKGGVSTFGPSRARDLAEALEIMGREQNLAGGEEVLAELEHAISELRPALEAVG